MEKNTATIDRSEAGGLQKFFFNLHVMIVMQQITVILFVLVKSHIKHEKKERKLSMKRLDRSMSSFTASRDIEMT